MKTTPCILIALMCVFTSLLTFEAAAQKKDQLGTSDAELERLKRLNTTSKVVSLPDTELRGLMVGKWTTGRHDYEYKSDGTWQMLPEIGGPHGTWRIENQRLIEDTGARTIMEASHKQIVLKSEQGTFPFRYVRTGTEPAKAASVSTTPTGLGETEESVTARFSNPKAAATIATINDLSLEHKIVVYRKDVEIYVFGFTNGKVDLIAVINPPTDTLKAITKNGQSWKSLSSDTWLRPDGKVCISTNGKTSFTMMDTNSAFYTDKELAETVKSLVSKYTQELTEEVD